MAELINKKDAIAIVKSIPCATTEEEFTKSTAEGCIKRLPTTTEAEIRAKALKYAQSRFRNTYETMVANKMENCINWADMLDLMLAEQLKEE